TDQGGLTLSGVSMTNWSDAAVNSTSPTTPFSVKGCFIGVAPDGTAAGNLRGISITNNDTQSGTIGSAANADRNVISGNSDYSGVAPDGVTAMGNGAGVRKNDASPLTLGGTGVGEQNIIAYNGVGLYLNAAADGNNLISANSIHDNTLLGIDRNAFPTPGVTA